MWALERSLGLKVLPLAPTVLVLAPKVLLVLTLSPTVLVLAPKVLLSHAVI